LYTGGYGPRKRIDDLISAFDQIASAVATGELVMAGVPSTDAWNAINRSRHRRRIRVTGFVDDDQLAQLYRSAEVVAYPTLLEGFGFPVVEAFASGTPIVATRSGSIPEIARGAALLVEPGDARELAEAIRSVLDGNGLATSLSSAGLGRVAEYGWPRVALQTLDVYRKAIRG
jgi:alpha-1,3-rhamnosyl/mannosyltransferase